MSYIDTASNQSARELLGDARDILNAMALQDTPSRSHDSWLP